MIYFYDKNTIYAYLVYVTVMAGGDRREREVRGHSKGAEQAVATVERGTRHNDESGQPV